VKHRSHIHDRALLEALERHEPVAIEQRVWRVSWKTRDVIQGGTGGRWNPAAGPGALYTSEAIDGALAEVYHHLAMAPVLSSCDKLCYPIDVKTKRSLRLDTRTAIASVGLTAESLIGGNLEACQAVGAAAQLLEFDSIWVPSARWPSCNLVVFLDAIPNFEDGLVPGTPDPVNWAAWREREDVARQLQQKPQVLFRDES
jgi:RES domain-containing protein